MKSNDKSLGEVIKEMLRTYHLEEKMNETRLIQSWSRVTGQMITRHTLSLNVRNRILFVKLDSPALRRELSFSREKLVKNLNLEAGADVIEDIVFN